MSQAGAINLHAVKNSEARSCNKKKVDSKAINIKILNKEIFPIKGAREKETSYTIQGSKKKREH